MYLTFHFHLDSINEEKWYIIVGVLIVLIIISLLGLCFILGRRREKAVDELLKQASKVKMAEENEYTKPQSFSEIKSRGPNPVRKD